MNVVDWYVVYKEGHRRMAEKLLRYLNRCSIWQGCWSIDESHSNSNCTVLIAQHEGERDIVPVTKDVINLILKDENQNT